MAAGTALGYNHPADCACALVPENYTAGTPTQTTTGPNATAAATGPAGRPDAVTSCVNLGGYFAGNATATAGRKDTVNGAVTGVGIWNVTVYLTDDYELWASAIPDQIVGPANARGRAMGTTYINTGSTSVLLDTGLVWSGSPPVNLPVWSGWVNSPDLTFTAYFGEGGTVPLEGFTEAYGFSKTLNSADAYGQSKSGGPTGSYMLAYFVIRKKTDIG